MICYKDRTFCVNEACTKRCKRFLTPEIEAAAKAYGLPVAVSQMICLDCGEDGTYELKIEETTDEEMS